MKRIYFIYLTLISLIIICTNVHAEHYDYAPGQLLVSFNESINRSQIDFIISNYNLTWKSSYFFDVDSKSHWGVVHVPVGEENTWIEIFSKNSDILAIEKNGIGSAAGPVKDSLENLNDSLENLNNSEKNKTEYLYLSNGRKAEIKILPETASIIAIERLGQLDFNITLKEIGKVNKTQMVYHLEAEKQAKLFWFIKKKAKVEINIDAENNGEIISTKRPWWSFIASGV